MVTAYTRLFIQYSTLQLCTKKRLIIQNQVNSSEQTMLHSVRATPANYIQWKEKLVCCESVGDKWATSCFLDLWPGLYICITLTHMLYTYMLMTFSASAAVKPPLLMSGVILQTFPSLEWQSWNELPHAGPNDTKREIIMTNAVPLQVCYCSPQLFPLN